MSLIAGAFALNGHLEGVPGLARGLESCWRRRPEDNFQILRGDGFVAAHLTLPGHAGQCASKDGTWTLLAGEPLSDNRSGDARLGEQLRSGWVVNPDPALGACEGDFALVQVEPSQGRLRLAVDKFGVRSLYFGIAHDVVFFATSMRALLHLCPSFSNRADIAGQSQKVALGYCLGARTPYAAVRVVEPAQVVEFRNGERFARYYFDWAAVEPFPGSEDEFARSLHRAFLDSVASRAEGEEACVAFLSGGLDSRCLTAALLALGKRVDTINHAPAGSEDLALGRLAAAALGTQHFEFPEGATDFRDRAVKSYRAWEALPSPHEVRPAPMRVWTGFGGDTVMAPTNVSESVAAALGKDDLRGAITAFLVRAGTAPSGRMMKPAWRTRFREELWQSIEAEVQSMGISDPRRGFHTLLVLNEPRGLVARHFEDLDERRLRYVFPFLDTRVVTLVLSGQLEWLLRHRFYYRWLDEFQAAVKSVPWQAYPWSLPCPLPVPSGLRRQWENGFFSASDQRRADKVLTDSVRVDLRRPGFPTQILDRKAVIAAYGLARVGVRRYLYMLRVAHAFAQMAAKSYD